MCGVIILGFFDQTIKLEAEVKTSLSLKVSNATE
jgi:hypothetical protein